MTAKWGLSLSPVSGFATLLWPPAAIALVSILLFGRTVWPAIFLGAFITNLTLGTNPFVTFGIAIGNTLEPLVGAYFLTRLGFQNKIDRVTDVVTLFIWAVLFSTLISATIGTFSLLLGGNINLNTYLETWAAWWLGDSLGILVFAPFLLLWSKRLYLRVNLKIIIETMVLLTAFLVVGFAIFGNNHSNVNGSIFTTAPYLLIPFLMWASLRFSGRFVAALIVLISAMTVWAAKYGNGPFIKGSLRESLLLSQQFIGVTAFTFLLISAVMAERKAAQSNAKQLNISLQKALARRTSELHHEKELDSYAMSSWQQLRTNLRRRLPP